jgi:hypothetical protein
MEIIMQIIVEPILWVFTFTIVLAYFIEGKLKKKKK